MDYIIYFAITIGILVFIHEFGHFAAAKLTGMRADVFAIGFGKRLFGWNKITGFTFGDLPEDFDGEGHTDYRLCLLPLGGYVKIAGMVDESFDTEFADKEPQPYEFRAKPVWKKVIVISAGVIMNLLLAWIIFWGANYFQGKPVTQATSIGYVGEETLADSLGFQQGDNILSINGKEIESWEDVRSQIYVNTLGEDLNFKLQRNGNTVNLDVPREAVPDETEAPLLVPPHVKPVITEVMNDSPADKAGIEAGDIFLELNNEELNSTTEATKIIKSHPQQEMPLTVLRGEDTLSLAVTPGEDGLIGVGIGQTYTGPVEYKTYGFFSSFYYGWMDIVRMTELTFDMMGKVISGKVEFGQAFGGPIKIAKFATTSAERGISSFLFFLALLSLSLAIINILPFPVLDGGHLVIIIIEGIMRREIPVKVKIAIQNTGFVLLLLLMAFIIYNDIISL